MFSFQGRHGNRSISLGLRTQGTLRRVRRSQLQIFGLLLSPPVLKGARFPSGEGTTGWGWKQERGSKASEDCWPWPGEGRVQAAGGPADPCGSWHTPPPAPCTAYILSLQNSISGGGVGVVLSSSFTPSHSVFTALAAVSRDLVSLPGPSVLLSPSPWALPGPRTLWRRVPSPSTWPITFTISRLQAMTATSSNRSLPYSGQK